MSYRPFAQATLLALALSLTASAEPVQPNRGAERDDPNVRRDGYERIYEKPANASFHKFMNRAAAAERARFGDASFGLSEPLVVDSATGAITNLAVAGSGTWTNLGPAGADYIQNGGSTLNKVDSGRVTEIVPVTGSLVYVAFAGGGVWKTADAGTTWQPITESLGSLSVGALAVDPTNSSVLYLGLGDAFDGTGIGMLKSTDGGATWDGFGPNGTVKYLGASTIINKVGVSAGGSTVMAATDKGLFRSVDAGQTWSAVALATGQAATPYAWDLAATTGAGWVLSLEANPAATSGTTDGQVWTSNNDGATWTRATGVAKTGGVGRISLAAKGTTVYAMAAVPNATSASDLADFFRSTNGGTSFTALGATGRKVRYTNSNTESTGPAGVLNGQGWYNHMLIVNPANANQFFFGGALLMGRATLSGSTWSYTQLTNWLAQFNLPYVHADFHAAAYAADGALWVGSDGGVFRSADNGATWADKNRGIVTHLMYSVGSTTANRNAVISGLQDNGTRVRSGATATFNQEIGGDGFGSVIHATDASKMIGSLYYTRIYKSTDGGLNFASACTGITECNNSSTAPFNTKVVADAGDGTGNTLYTHTNSKVYRSTNFAGSWAQVGATFPTGVYLRNVGVGRVNGTVYVGAVASGGRVYLSSNGGATWSAQITNLPGADLSMNSVAFGAGDTAGSVVVYVSSVAPNGAAKHLWKSTDFGASWTAIDGGGLPTGVPVNSVSVDPGSASTLFAGTHLGVYRSDDRGATWYRFGGTSMPLVNVTDLYVSGDGSLVRAATFGRGIWEYVP